MNPNTEAYEYERRYRVRMNLVNATTDAREKFRRAGILSRFDGTAKLSPLKRAVYFIAGWLMRLAVRLP